MTSTNKNILQIVEDKLCNSCGACFGVCPTEAISFKETISGNYFPVVNKDRCTECGLCYNVCAGRFFGYSLLKKLPKDPFIGDILGSFVGQATDNDVLNNSQSGGVVSAILAHSLETGLINGAATVVMNYGNPSRPIVRIARSTEEIYQAQKSKYCPVPLLSFLRDLKSDDNIAVVGVSCQIHGLLNVIDNKPSLKNKIAIAIGLICDRTLTYKALDYLIKKSGATITNSNIIHFRDKSVSGYPGDVHVISEENNSFILPSSFRMQIKDFFTPARCRICFDKMNVFADITAGDPHGIDNIDKQCGETVILSRTSNGEKFLKSAIKANAIKMRPVTNNSIINGQRIDMKKKQWQGFANAWIINELSTPNYFKFIKQNLPVNEDKYYRHKLQVSFYMDNVLNVKNLFAYVEKTIKQNKQRYNYKYPIIFLKIIVKKLLRFFNY